MNCLSCVVVIDIIVVIYVLKLGCHIFLFYVAGWTRGALGSYTMAVPFMFTPGGQPILMGQIPLIPTQQIPMPTGQHPPPPQPQKPKIPDYMSEEKLQEKGKCGNLGLLWMCPVGEKHLTWRAPPFHNFICQKKKEKKRNVRNYGKAKVHQIWNTPMLCSTG